MMSKAPASPSSNSKGTVATKEGFPDLRWPVSQDEVLAVRDELLHRIVKVVRGNPGPKQILPTLLTRFTVEAVSAYRRTALERRLDETDPRPRALRSGTVREGVPRRLQAGPPPGRRWVPNELSRIRWTSHLNEGWLAGLNPYDAASDVSSPTVSPLVAHHARTSPETVHYHKHRHWFGPLSRRSRSDSSPPPANLFDAVERCVEHAYNAGNEELPRSDANKLRRWLATASALALEHLGQLDDREDLPTHLWTGTGGYIWSALLRNAVHRNGGRVTGHAHSTGEGTFTDHLQEIKEFIHCDTFVASTPGQVGPLSDSVDRSLLVDPSPTEIRGISRTEGTGLDLLSGPREPRKPPKRWMAVTGLVRGWKVPLVGTNLSWEVAADWWARLFHNLSRWGLDVTHKPHPESNTPPPAFEGVQRSAQPFEDVWHEADAFIFDSTRTSPLGEALWTDRPIVLVDFGLMDWNPDIERALHDRCAIVEGWFDQDGRAHVDWSQLEEAVNAAPDRLTPEFARNFIPSTHRDALAGRG